MGFRDMGLAAAHDGAGCGSAGTIANGRGWVQESSQMIPRPGHVMAQQRRVGREVLAFSSSFDLELRRHLSFALQVRSSDPQTRSFQTLP